MDLSREAIINLAPTTGDWQAPTVAWLRGPWDITHATGSHHHGKKNVRVHLKTTAALPSYTAELSHQDAQTLEIETLSLAMTPLDLSEKDNNTASRFALPNASIEILAWGKEGQLSDWMTEENGWIADGSGESRPDWRRRYAVVRVHEGGASRVEVWASASLAAETVAKMEDALKGAGVDGHLLPVAMDDGRDEDDREKWLKENGPLCADIDLSEPEEEKSRCRCM